MSLVRFFLGALLLGSSAAEIKWDHDDECPPNEFWADASSCNPVNYQPACGNDNCGFVDPGTCTPVCFINRCFCNPGYKRDCKGRCIPSELCSCSCTPCGTNQVWSACSNAAPYGCPPNYPPTPAVCTGGCVCKPTYFPPSNCLNKCGIAPTP